MHAHVAQVEVVRPVSVDTSKRQARKGVAVKSGWERTFKVVGVKQLGSLMSCPARPTLCQYFRA